MDANMIGYFIIGVVLCIFAVGVLIARNAIIYHTRAEELSESIDDKIERLTEINNEMHIINVEMKEIHNDVVDVIKEIKNEDKEL